MSDVTNHEKLMSIERFYKNAFCAKSVKVLDNTKDFKIEGVVEIETGDGRGTIFIGSLKALEE